MIARLRGVGQIGVAGDQGVIGRADRIERSRLACRTEDLQRGQRQFDGQIPVVDPDTVGDRERGCGQDAIKCRVGGVEGEIAYIEEQADAEDRQQRNGPEQDVALN